MQVPARDFFHFLIFIRYHTCDLCNVVSINDTTARDKEKQEALSAFGTVIIVRECKWRKSGHVAKRSPYSPFYYDSKIDEKKLLYYLRTGEFFGFLNVTMTAPAKTRSKFDKVNFPPLFLKHQPKKTELGERMQIFFDKEPTSQVKYFLFKSF